MRGGSGGVVVVVVVLQGVATKHLLVLVHFSQNREAHLLNQHAGFS